MNETKYSVLEGSLLDRGKALWQSATEIWLSGGWAMIVIAVIGFIIFALGTHVFIRLRSIGHTSVPETIWRRWINHPTERRGRIGKMLDFVTASASLRDMSHAFDQLRETQTGPLERDLRVMKVFVSAAPLVGLLGTVMGMLATFAALATGSGGEKTMAQVAGGISEALITTETGLVIALPGLFFQYQMSRKLQKYKAFLAHLESVCSQKRYRDQRELRKAELRKIARQRVAQALYQNVTQSSLEPAVGAEKGS